MKILTIRLSTIFLIMSLLLLGAVSAQAKGNPYNDVLNLDNSILQLHAKLQGASGTEKQHLHKEALELFKQRAASLKELIISDPEHADELTFSSPTLANLKSSFPEASPYLESKGEWQGRLEAFYSDDFENSNSKFLQFLNVKGQRLELYSANQKLLDMKAGTQLKIKGIRVDHLLLADKQAASVTTLSTETEACSVFGPQKSVTILVNFKDFSLPSSITPDYVNGVLYGNVATTAVNDPDWSVNDFLQQNSNNQISMDASSSRIVGPYSLNYNYNGDTPSQLTCDWQAVRNDAVVAAEAEVDFSQYSRILIVMPNNTRCGWIGLGSVGCDNFTTSTNLTINASDSFLRADYMQTRDKGVKLTAHEFGHNLTLGHARLRDCSINSSYEPLGPLGNACAIYEYSDYFSTMGNVSNGFYSAKHLVDLGWLQQDSNYSVVEGNGTYTLQKYEDNNVLKALKVRRGIGNDAWLWIEARRNSGIYDSYLVPNVFTGALIHYQDLNTGNRTDLLDFTPLTSIWEDSTMPVGETWNDPYSNLAITVDSETPDSVTVSTNYAASETPCSPIKPTVLLAPATVTMQPGSTYVFTFDVTNPTTNCPALKYDIIAIKHPGWTATYDVSSFVLKSGETKRTYLTLTAPANEPPGHYIISAKAFDSNGLSSVDSSGTDIPAPPTYSLFLTKNGMGSVNFTPPNANCTTNCFQNYAPGTTVVLTATPSSGYNKITWSGACSGTSNKCTVTMNAHTWVTVTFSKKR